MKTLIFIIFLSTKIYAEAIPLPASLSGVDEIISEFRIQLATKMVDLGKNYISIIKDESLVFTSSEVVNCNGDSIQPRTPLASIVYNHQKQNDELLEKIIYRGCNNDISLTEEITSKGINLAPLPFSEITKGKRTFDLKENENSRYYKTSNSLGEELFSVYIEKNEHSKVITFNILGKKFLTINFEYQADQTLVVYSYYGYVANYKRRYAKWDIKNNLPTQVNSVIVKRGEFARYLDNENNLISLNTFINNFNKVIMDNSVSKISEFFEYHNYYFPDTESTKSGSQSQRFMDEVRIAKNRINSNTEINLVKILLQNLYDAAELGQIIDNRPKKN